MNNTTPPLTVRPISGTTDEYLADDIKIGSENAKQSRMFLAIVSRTLGHIVTGSCAVEDWSDWKVWKRLPNMDGASRRELVDEALAEVPHATIASDLRGQFADALADEDWGGAKPIFVTVRGETREFAVAEVRQNFELL